MTQPKIEGVGHGVPRMLYASDGSNWYAILVDSDGHVKIDVVTSALPTDAATQTTLASCLTALQLIDDLRSALDSVGTDELDVNVEAYDPVPSSPVVNTGSATNIASGAWAELLSYSVPADKTFYLTDLYATDGMPAAGVEFLYVVEVNSVDVIEGRIRAGDCLREHLNTPLKATAGQTVTIDIYQWSTATKTMMATVIGFLV